MDTFDYLIIGSGAAGSVLANRLSEDGRATICVLEAGAPDTNPYIRIPAGYIKNLNRPEMAWQFHSEAASGTAGRRIYLPQGRVMGGSTSINGLVYNRGQAGDFNRWAEMGATGWGYSDVLPYFRRSESRLGGDPAYRGTDGPLQISDIGARDPICDAWIQAVGAHDVPMHNDYNGESQRGAGYYQRFIHEGKRITAASAFLKPAMARPNVKVITRALATRILFEGKRAVGIEYRVNGEPGKTVALKARREVILSAGTVNTTRLMQVSGIGPGSRLQSLGINVVHDLPGVGENFQDHYFVRFVARFKDGTVSLNQQASGLRLVGQIVNWLRNKPSVLALSPSVAYAFLHSSDLSANPELQFVFTPGSYRPGKVYELDDFAGATSGFTQQRPDSTGYIRITSPDPLEMPTIQPNYLQAETDQQVAIRGMRLTRQFLNSPAMSHLLERETAPGADVDSDEQLLEFARQSGNTGYHLVGTSTMGAASDPMAVVSPSLKVHGLEGLRVIDASVMPRVTSSNTCAATLMIAEKGADLV
ncbi:MAG: GMC family oxidoreductase N-terminal domain-containing protein, partial [Burkholderiaceae bacterium]